jgi:hypothetical protein
MALASAFLQSLRHDLFLHARPRGSALSFEDITVLALLNQRGRRRTPMRRLRPARRALEHSDAEHDLACLGRKKLAYHKADVSFGAQS